MCGIVGYFGDKPSEYIILNALKRLEYRGYDSAGISLLNKNNEIFTLKEQGKIINLENNLFKKGKIAFESVCGIGHTRWATHGEPSQANAHPHTDCTNSISVVHNGIIENYSVLKKQLTSKGHTFNSATDTEVIPHLIEDYWKESENILFSVENAIKNLKGAYALGIIIKNKENVLVGVRKGSPLVLGIGENEFFLASDIPAFLDYTNKVVFLEDNDIVIIKKDNFKIYNTGKEIERSIKIIKWDASQAKKSGFKHYMLKEINEQPEAILNTIIDKVNFENYKICFEDFNENFAKIFKNDKKIIISACGTSWHSSLIGKFLIEALTNLHVEVDYSSELRYREKKSDENTVIIAVSQSGETADTLEVIKNYKQNSTIISICNVLGSSIPRESDYTIYTHAGPEISVASTKAFTTQVIVFFILSLYLAKLRDEINDKDYKEYINQLRSFHNVIKKTLTIDSELKKIAPELSKYSNFLFLGRGINYPVALEGALKLKEISYIHAEGYPGGEMKHGPLALIDENFPAVILLPKDRLYDKMLGNLNEIKSRRGKSIVFTSENNSDDLSNIADYCFKIPEVTSFLQPIIYTIPLQLLSYYIADFKGCDIDQPRNLAKSVTVE